MSLSIVYIPGKWDVLHIGHLNMLERAGAYGDRLIVGVESDRLIEEETGQPPVIKEQDRCRMLQALRAVDAAVVYNTFDYWKTVKNLNANVLIFGESHTQDRHMKVQVHMEANRKSVVRLPYTEGVSSTMLKAGLK